MMRARPVLALATWLLPLLACGCMVQVGSCSGSWSYGGHSVSERDGHLVVDNVVLPYERWVDVDLEAGSLAQLDVQTATGGVELQGGDAQSCKLSVHLHSSVENDGEIKLHDGKLQASSQHDGKVFINGVKGSVPAEIGLVIGTGTGDVLVEHAAKGKALSIDTGTGDVTVRGSEPASLDVDLGSGDVRLEQGGATSVRSTAARATSRSSTGSGARSRSMAARPTCGSRARRSSRSASTRAPATCAWRAARSTAPASTRAPATS